MKTGHATPAGIDVASPEYAGEIIVLVRRALVRLDRSIAQAPSERVRRRFQRIRKEIESELESWEARIKPAEPTWRDELAEMLGKWEGHMARIDAALASASGEARTIGATPLPAVMTLPGDQRPEAERSPTREMPSRETTHDQLVESKVIATGMVRLLRAQLAEFEDADDDDDAFSTDAGG